MWTSVIGTSIWARSLRRPPLLGVEGAKFTELIADIGIVYMLVANIEGFIAMQALPHKISEEADASQVRRLVKTHAVVVRESRTVRDLIIYVHQRCAHHAFCAAAFCCHQVCAHR